MESPCKYWLTCTTSFNAFSKKGTWFAWVAVRVLNASWVIVSSWWEDSPPSPASYLSLWSACNQRNLYWQTDQKDVLPWECGARLYLLASFSPVLHYPIGQKRCLIVAEKQSLLQHLWNAPTLSWHESSAGYPALWALCWVGELPVNLHVSSMY